MTYKNLFDATQTQETINRIEQLSPTSQALWGKMNVAQMLAHCNVVYEKVYTDKHPKPNFIARMLLNWFAKPVIAGTKPYPKNSRTAPEFIIADERDFAAEKERLIGYLQKTQQLGAAHFDGKEYVSLGKLSVAEWNWLFSKHLDHHLRQFGV